jgi:hypothetical protein
MTHLQIGLTGRYQGRGFWRRVFGSGPARITPIDAPIADNDRDAVVAAAQTISQFLAQQKPTRHRAGSLFDLTDVQAFVRTVEK